MNEFTASDTCVKAMLNATQRWARQERALYDAKKHALEKFALISFASCLAYLPLPSVLTPSRPNEPETYTRLNISLGGAYFSGNVNQVQANIQGHWAISSPTAGLDVLTNGYRLWNKDSNSGEYDVAGDTYSLQPIHSGTLKHFSSGYRPLRNRTPVL